MEGRNMEVGMAVGYFVGLWVEQPPINQQSGNKEGTHHIQDWQSVNIIKHEEVETCARSYFDFH